MNDHLVWSNLVYLAVSRVEYLRQIERVWVPRQLSVKGEGKYEEIISHLAAEENPTPLKNNVFDRIFHNDNKIGIALEGHFTAKDFQSLVVVHDEKACKIMTFPDREEFWDWYRELPNKHIHEVIFGPKLQRIKFDLDIAAKERADTIVESMLDTFLNVVVVEFYACYAPHAVLERDDIILADSSGPLMDGDIQIGYKHSYHVILTQYCVANNEEAEYFTARVLDRLDPKIGRFVDAQVNKCIQNFRIAERRKVDSDRVKELNSQMAVKLGTRSTCLEESLITATDELELERKLPPPKLRTLTPIKTNREDVNVALRLASKIIWPDDGIERPAHKYTSVRGGLILFKRERPSYCQLCDRTHDNDNTLMIMIKDGVVTEHCWRVEEGRVLGKLLVKKIDSEKRINTAIRKKIVSYKIRDSIKKNNFDLDVDYVLELKRAKENHCAACNIEMLWIFRPGDTRQFSVDRIDNKYGQNRHNVRLTCLECNRNRGAAIMAAEPQEAPREQIPA